MRVLYPSPQLLSVTSSSTNPRRSNPPKVTPSTPASHSQSPALPSTPSTSSIADTGDGIASRKRGLSFDTDTTNPKRRRSSTYNSRQSGDKSQNKGLRHFSQRVCEKVRDKGTTTYNEVSSFVRWHCFPSISALYLEQSNIVVQVWIYITYVELNYVCLIHFQLT